MLNVYTNGPMRGTWSSALPWIQETDMCRQMVHMTHTYDSMIPGRGGMGILCNAVRFPAYHRDLVERLEAFCRCKFSTCLRGL